MLTPIFTLSQDDNFITITVKAPYTNIKDTEIFVDGSEFRFYSKPYFLRLNLPGNISENGEESAKYDGGDGSYVIRFPKENPGEHFDGLDMLTSLLLPKKDGNICPKIEVLESTVSDEGACGNESSEEEEEFDWHIPQSVTHDNSLGGGTKYGFGLTKSNVFSKIGEETTRELIDLYSPEATCIQERATLRLEDEIQCFNEDHYLADLFEDDVIKSLLDFIPVWEEKYVCKKANNIDPAMHFTDKEKDQMIKLPKKEFIFSEKESLPILLGLVDLMLAYSYNHRINEGENNVESSWNIRKLSPSLCWLDVPTDLTCVVVNFFRRVLCFPLYRHFGLAAKVLEDVQHMFVVGKQQLLRCLLDIHAVFNSCEPHYILNELYITDYCVWIQTVKPQVIEKLAGSLAQIQVSKKDVGLDLVELETAALLAQGDADIESTTNQMSGLGVTDQSSRDVDSDDDSDGSYCETDTTETDADSSESESIQSGDSSESHDRAPNGDLDTHN